jgi:hypothetical protein
VTIDETPFLYGIAMNIVRNLALITLILSGYSLFAMDALKKAQKETAQREQIREMNAAQRTALAAQTAPKRTSESITQARQDRLDRLGYERVESGTFLRPGGFGIRSVLLEYPLVIKWNTAQGPKECTIPPKDVGGVYMVYPIDNMITMKTQNYPPGAQESVRQGTWSTSSTLTKQQDGALALRRNFMPSGSTIVPEGNNILTIDIGDRGFVITDYMTEDEFAKPSHKMIKRPAVTVSNPSSTTHAMTTPGDLIERAVYAMSIDALRNEIRGLNGVQIDGGTEEHDTTLNGPQGEKTVPVVDIRMRNTPGAPSMNVFARGYISILNQLRDLKLKNTGFYNRYATAMQNYLNNYTPIPKDIVNSELMKQYQGLCLEGASKDTVLGSMIDHILTINPPVDYKTQARQEAEFRIASPQELQAHAAKQREQAAREESRVASQQELQEAKQRKQSVEMPGDKKRDRITQMISSVDQDIMDDGLKVGELKRLDSGVKTFKDVDDEIWSKITRSKWIIDQTDSMRDKAKEVMKILIWASRLMNHWSKYPSEKSTHTAELLKLLNEIQPPSMKKLTSLPTLNMDYFMQFPLY